MQAAVYTRVSTLGQVEGTSLDTQVAACLEMADTMGYLVDDSYIWKDQRTGEDPDRPGMVNLKSVLAAGEVQMLFAFSPERIARDPLPLMIFLEYLDEIGVGFQFVHGPSGNSPEEKMMQYLLGYVGQRERIDIAERTNRGKRKIAESGRLPIGIGAGLYGYDYDRQTKKRTVNEHEATIVMRMFKQYVEGRSLYAIARDLNESGVKTKRGCLWHPLTVRRIVENLCYKGETWYGKYRCTSVRGGKVERVERPESERIRVDGFTPRIVSDAVFGQAQDQLLMPKAQNRKPHKQYLLTGFARCELCAAPVVGASIHGQYRYYHCRATNPTSTGPKTCNARYINADRLEAVVWDHVANMISDPTLIMENIREYLETDGGDLRQEINRLGRRIGKAKEQERKLVGLYANDLIEDEMLNDQIAPIKVAREQLEHELQELQQQQALNDDVQIMEQRVTEYYRLLNEGLVSQAFEGKRAALTAFDVKTVVSKENVTVNVTIDPGFPTTERTSASPSNDVYSFVVVGLKRVADRKRAGVMEWDTYE